MSEAFKLVYGVDNQPGTSDPGPEHCQHYEVHCSQCCWWGMLSQMKATYNSHSEEPKPCCPMCLSDQWLEYEELLH